MRFKTKLLITLALFIFTVLIRVPVLRSVGETWDEFTVVNPGETYISAIKNLDFSESPWIQNYEHPPVAKYFYGLSRIISRHSPFIKAWDSEYYPDKEYTVPRLLSAVFGGLTVVLVFLIGGLLFSPIVGVVSALILAITPHFIAYTATSSLESPFLFFTTLFIYLLLRALRTSSPGIHFLTVAALTLSFASRYNGIFFVLFYGLVMIFHYRKELRTFQLKKIPWPVLFSPLIFIALNYLIWPWLWLSPYHFLDSVFRSTGGHSGEFFLGSWRQPGHEYYPIYLLVTTSEVLIVLLGLFVSLVIWKLAKQKLEVRYRNWKLEIRKNSNFQNLTSFQTSNFYSANFLLLWFLTPFLATLSDFKQDGIRYVIAFTPALAVISGFTVVWLYGYLKSRRLKIVFVSSLLLGLLYPVVLYFPYYLDYYNLASGGPKAAYENKWFDVGWWGEGGISAVRYVNNNAPKNSVVRMHFGPRHTLIKLRPDLRPEQNFILNNKDDFILTNTFNEWYGNPKMLSDLSNYRLVYEVKTPAWEMFSAPLVKVYKRL